MNQINLFPSQLDQCLNYNGEVYYQENFISDIDLNDLASEIIWQQDHIQMFGKIHPLPRLTAFQGETGIKYEYSKIKMNAAPYTPHVLKIKESLIKNLGMNFNSVLINFYRNGHDHMSFHSDDEKELGINPTIASVSFGATRKFVLKHRYDKSLAPFEINLHDKSLLIMSGELQHFWVHKISKKLTESSPRINLTFRKIFN